MTSFHLRKWYLDVTTADRAFIGYAATIRWKKLSLNYHGSILAGTDGVVQRNSFRKTVFPVAGNNTLSWKCGNISGTWESVSQPAEEMLLQHADGDIHWQCTQPKAKATVHIGNEQPLEGWGYTEFIEMTLPPWKLPIRELHWGRFTGETDAVTWIEWRGDVPKTLVFHNGVRYTEAIISTTAIHFGAHRLEIENPVPLRSGAVRSTVFRRFPWMRKLFPHSIFHTEEAKWFSTGKFFGGGKLPAHGKIIHETVLWR